MQQVVLKNATVRFQPGICFVFNKNMVFIESDTLEKITFEVEDYLTKKRYSDERRVSDGICYVNLSGYLQQFFKHNDLIQQRNVTIYISSGENGSDLKMQYNLECIWGALNIGDAFNEERTVKWFKKFPQTFSMYVTSVEATSIRFDKEPLYVNKDLGLGLVHIDLKSIFPVAQKYAEIKLEDYPIESVFDDTYDYTFRPIGEGTIINRLVIDESECGYFLRWIDRHGFYQYYLFRPGKEQHVTQSLNDDVLKEFYHGDKDFGIDKFGLYYDFTSPQQKTDKLTISAGAFSENENNLKMLLTIHTSPSVAMWINKSWVPVKISPATIVKDKSVLQDFEIEIELPEIITQKL